jgi:hypothetical protein
MRGAARSLDGASPGSQTWIVSRRCFTNNGSLKNGFRNDDPKN